MKKQAILLIFLAFAISVSAVQAVLFPSLADSTYSYSVTLRTNVNGSIGSYQHHYIYKKSGDTAFVAGPVFSTNAVVLWRSLDSLQAATRYDSIFSIVENNGVYDTSQPISVTTKPEPLPLVPIQISNVHVNPSLQQTIVYLHGEALNYSFLARVYYGNQGFPSQPIILTGIVDTFIVITTPNTAGTTYTNNYIYVEPVGNVPANITYQFFPFANYTVPGPTSADVTAISLVAPAGTTDSLYGMCSVTIGNNIDAVITRRKINAQGSVIQTLSAFTISHDTIFSTGFGGLQNGTAYSWRVVVVAPGGSDSAQTGPTTTNQIPYGTIGNWNLSASTTTSTNVQVMFHSNGTSAQSIGQAWIEYFDRDNVWRITDTASGIMGDVYKTFWMTNLRSGPSQNPATVYYKNAAGLVTILQITVQVVTPISGFVIPTTWTLSSPDPSSLQVNNADCMPNAGDQGAVLVGVVRPSFSSVGDTIILESGINNHVIVSPVIPNLTGSTVYFVQLIGRSGSGLQAGNGIEKSSITNTPINPALADCVIDSFKNATVYYHVAGNGNGTLTTYTTQLFQSAGGSVTNQYAVAVGTGNIHYPYSYPNLMAGTEYKIWNQFTGPNNSNAVTLEKYFTMVATGIETVKAPTIDPNTFVTVYDESGQRMITSGKFGTIHHNVNENGYRGIYFVKAASGAGLKYGLFDS